MSRSISLFLGMAVALTASQTSNAQDDLYPSDGIGCDCSGGSHSPTVYYRIPVQLARCPDGACLPAGWLPEPSLPWFEPQAPHQISVFSNRTYMAAPDLAMQPPSFRYRVQQQQPHQQSFIPGALLSVTQPRRNSFVDESLPLTQAPTNPVSSVPSRTNSPGSNLSTNGAPASPGISAPQTEPALVAPPVPSRINNAPTESRSGAPSIPSQAGQIPTIPKEMEGLAKLSVADQLETLQQRTCPVTKQPLGSMGQPIRVSVQGRSLFVCCEGCVDSLKTNPAKYLTTMPATTTSFQQM